MQKAVERPRTQPFTWQNEARRRECKTWCYCGIAHPVPSSHLTVCHVRFPRFHIFQFPWPASMLLSSLAQQQPTWTWVTWAAWEGGSQGWEQQDSPGHSPEQILASDTRRVVSYRAGKAQATRRLKATICFSVFTIPIKYLHSSWL